MSERYLVTRYLTENANMFRELSDEALESISEVHFADQLGAQGTYGISLEPDFAEYISKADNLLPVNGLMKLSDYGLGEWEQHTTSEVVQPLTPYLEGVPELEPLDFEELGNKPSPAIDGSAEFRDTMVRSYRYHKAGGITDQGKEGACVGHCKLNFLTASPVRSFPGLDFAGRNRRALEFYRECQRNDEWQGEEYSGTSVSAACKLLIRDGHAKSVAVTTSFEEILRWKLYKGPLLLSVPWYEGSYRTDAKGFIRPTGRKVGGHAILDRATTVWRTAVWRNSWGLPFGFNGDGYVAEQDYRWWISQGLRAYAGIQVK